MKTTKRCPTHDGGQGRVLPISSFHRDRNALDGHQSRCKTCLNVRRRERYARSGTSSRGQYSSLRSRACRLGVGFDLTFEEFGRLIAMPCAYGGGTRPQLNIGVDRKDPSLGYIAGNVVPCCPRHNRIKSDLFAFDSMKRIVAEFAEARTCANQERRTPRKFKGALSA